MPTPRILSLVSLAALTVGLGLGGCASAPSRAPTDASARSDRRPFTVEFDNLARDYVHVYLVGERREWLLGRVEPLGRATLRVPDAALDGDPSFIRLAVLEGQRATLRVANDPRATTTIAQPTASILTQRWTFTRSATAGQLAGLRRP